MKDKQAINRGNCTVPDCECTEYMKPQDTGVRCDYCDHAPVKHVKIIELGACTKCDECPSYESENAGSYSDCEYCECPAKCHEGGDKRNEIIHCTLFILSFVNSVPQATQSTISCSHCRITTCYIANYEHASDTFCWRNFWGDTN